MNEGQRKIKWNSIEPKKKKVTLRKLFLKWIRSSIFNPLHLYYQNFSCLSKWLPQIPSRLEGMGRGRESEWFIHWTIATETEQFWCGIWPSSIITYFVWGKKSLQSAAITRQQIRSCWSCSSNHMPVIYIYQWLCLKTQLRGNLWRSSFSYPWL